MWGRGGAGAASESALALGAWRAHAGAGQQHRWGSWPAPPSSTESSGPQVWILPEVMQSPTFSNACAARGPARYRPRSQEAIPGPCLFSSSATRCRKPAPAPHHIYPRGALPAVLRERAAGRRERLTERPARGAAQALPAGEAGARVGERCHGCCGCCCAGSGAVRVSGLPVLERTGSRARGGTCLREGKRPVISARRGGEPASRAAALHGTPGAGRQAGGPGPSPGRARLMAV